MPRKKPGTDADIPATPAPETDDNGAATPAPSRDRLRGTARVVEGIPQASRAPGEPPSPPAAEPHSDGAGQLRIPEVLPVLRTGASVLYPAIVVPLVTSEEADVRAVDDAVTTAERLVAVVAQQQGSEGAYDGEMQAIGTAAQIVRMAKAPNGTLQALIQGVARIRILGVEQREPWLRVRVERIGETLEPSTELEALVRSAISLFQKIVALSDQIPGELGGAVSQISHPGNLADFIAANSGLKPEDRQAVLAEANVTERLRVLTGALNRELEILEVSSQIQTQVRGDMDKRQREFILREQLRAIQKELGDDEAHPEIGELRQKLDDAHLPDEARKQADRELERLATMTPAAADYNVARTYLEWLADLPWDKRTEDQLDINEAQRILDADHYGLEKIKQRIL